MDEMVWGAHGWTRVNLRMFKYGRGWVGWGGRAGWGKQQDGNPMPPSIWGWDLSANQITIARHNIYTTRTKKAWNCVQFAMPILTLTSLCHAYVKPLSPLLYWPILPTLQTIHTHTHTHTHTLVKNDGMHILYTPTHPSSSPLLHFPNFPQIRHKDLWCHPTWWCTAPPLGSSSLNPAR